MRALLRHLPMPGLLWGDYPERQPPQASLARRVEAALRQASDTLADRMRAAGWLGDAAWLARVRAAQSLLARSTLIKSANSSNDADIEDTRQALLRHGLAGPALVQALALVAHTAQQHLGLAAFDSQLLAARAVLHNQLAEMATGEGKTLAVALAAAVAALAGVPVHVVTANDYLVARDAQDKRPLYTALGLSVGWVQQSDAPDARARAYACHITYVSAQELVFDYLRDALGAHPGDAGPGRTTARRRSSAVPAGLARLQSGAGASPPPALLRGLCMAIVDEADAILIDEARVPLILSQSGTAAAPQQHAEQALRLAKTLRTGVDFKLDADSLQTRLSASGRQRLDAAAASLAQACQSAAWRNRLHREHAVTTALSALHAYHLQRHYLVLEGQLHIIDQASGRLAEGRVWSQGLQQLIEIKEGLAPTPPMQTLAQLTYQRFFPRYLRLGGLSGTLLEARGELMACYGLSVRRVPLRRPNLRVQGGIKMFADHALLWAAVVGRVADLQTLGRPVLVATDSVAEAQSLAALLTARGLPHAVLHAQHAALEASLVAQAGQRGAITVTTNMAGRGTDIVLGPGVAALGGLHVLCCQLNSARRTDRQLAGRAARQGDPGSVQTWLSLDNAVLVQTLPVWLRRALLPLVAACPSWALRAALRALQAAEESSQREQRRRLIEFDQRNERRLGFAGVSE